MSARLARAILARLDGVFDDPDLLSFGALSDTDTDIRRFCGEVIDAEPWQDRPKIGVILHSGEPWVDDWIGADEIQTAHPSFDAAKAKNAEHGHRWYAYEAYEETQDGKRGYRLTDKD